jgi:hypothetical protein
MSRINLEDSRLERPLVVKGLKYGVTVLSGTGNTTLTEDMGPVLAITPTASRTLTLPLATPARKGLTYIVANGAAFTVVVQSPTGPATVATVPATVGVTGSFVCLGDPALGIGGWTGGL